MYQLTTKLHLWDLPSHFQEEIGQISIRGNSQEAPVNLPAEYSFPIRANHIRPLSVEKIARDFCPLRRDLYLEIRNRVRNERSIWGQTAGTFIERYFKGMFAHFSALSSNPENLTYQEIDALSRDYSEDFWKKNKCLVHQLERKATRIAESPEKLKFFLTQSTKYELLMLKADYVLSLTNSESSANSGPIELTYDAAHLDIKPEPRLGLSKLTTPDFLINQPIVIIGEIKTGTWLSPYYLEAVTGFALAYESENEIPVNFGMVYFVETHSDCLSFARTYIFVIDDFLRRNFLDRRNNTYSLLLGEEPPITDTFQAKYYEDRCSKCKYLQNCYPNGQ